MENSKSYRLNSEVQDLSVLTGYPPSVVKDILEASRMYIIDQISENAQNFEDKPTRYEFDLPGYGFVRLIRLNEAETTDSRWVFIPDDNFREEFFNAFYYGISPVINKARVNFDELMKARLGNILKGDD